MEMLGGYRKDGNEAFGTVRFWLGVFSFAEFRVSFFFLAPHGRPDVLGERRLTKFAGLSTRKHK